MVLKPSPHDLQRLQGSNFPFCSYVLTMHFDLMSCVAHGYHLCRAGARWPFLPMLQRRSAGCQSGLHHSSLLAPQLVINIILRLPTEVCKHLVQTLF